MLCVYDGCCMNLPNGERAIVDIRKPQEYCLNPQHPRGRHKARVFASVGIREAEAEELRTALPDAAITRKNLPRLTSYVPWQGSSWPELRCTRWLRWSRISHRKA